MVCEKLLWNTSKRNRKLLIGYYFHCKLGSSFENVKQQKRPIGKVFDVAFALKVQKFRAQKDGGWAGYLLRYVLETILGMLQRKKSEV